MRGVWWRAQVPAGGPLPVLLTRVTVRAQVPRQVVRQQPGYGALLEQLLKLTGVMKPRQIANVVPPAAARSRCPQLQCCSASAPQRTLPPVCLPSFVLEAQVACCAGPTQSTLSHSA